MSLLDADAARLLHAVAVGDGPGDNERFDAVVVGSGATGGWAAWTLASRGLRVLVLEAGALVGPDLLGPALAPGVAADARRQRQAVQSCHSHWWSTPELFVDDVDNPYSYDKDAPFCWIRGRQVGGRSLTWGGVAFRMSDFEFQAGRHDGFDRSWPISQAELAPFYGEVERGLGVRGAPDGLPQLPSGEILAPQPMTPAEGGLRAALAARWPDRPLIHARGILDSVAARGSSGQPFHCGSSSATTLPAAARTGRLTLRTNAVVSHIVTSPTSGLATGVVFVDDRSGALREARGRTVVLCASTLESVRILLSSRAPRHPTGLGDANGLLGKFVMDHHVQSVGGVVETAETSGPPLRGADSVYVPWIADRRRQPREFIRGYGLWGGVARGFSRDTAGPGEAPFFFSAIGEMLPRYENACSLHAELKDAWGLPALHLNVRHASNELAMGAHQLQALTELADACSAKRVVKSPRALVPGLYVHELGGARMGLAEAHSVLNRTNQVWEAPNVFVTDGACWVTSGYQNPTLTMMAITVRACYHLAAELTRRNL